MLYANISGFERPISRLVMGTMVCTTDNMELTGTLLDAYVAAGGNCLDTAYVYGGGKVEAAVGLWMQERGNRERIIVIGKGAHPKTGEPRVNPESIDEDIAESLERFQSDYMDIYLLHRDDSNYPVGPIVERLNAHKRAGRIRAFGGSNWTPARIEEANAYAAARGLDRFVAVSNQLCLAAPNEPMWGGCVFADRGEITWHEKTQFPLMPWSAQASGFFTGRYRPEEASNADVVRVYYNEGNWERLRRARELGDKKRATANQIALAYVLQQPFPCFPLIGPRTLEELAESLPALDIALTPQEMRWLNLDA